MKNQQSPRSPGSKTTRGGAPRGTPVGQRDEGAEGTVAATPPDPATGHDRKGPREDVLRAARWARAQVVSSESEIEEGQNERREEPDDDIEGGGPHGTA